MRNTGDFPHLLKEERGFNIDEFPARVSMRFISSNLQSADDAITETLEDCGRLTWSDRVYICQLVKEDAWQYTHKWERDKTVGVPHITPGDMFVSGEYPWLEQNLLESEEIHLTSLDELPGNASAEKRFFNEAGVKSLYILPMVRGKKVIGFLGFEKFLYEESYAGVYQRILRTIATILAQVFGRIATEKQRDYELRFRLLLTEISSDFVNISSEKYNQAVNKSLSKIGRFFDADRSFLFMYHPKRNTYSVTHEWVREGCLSSKEHTQEMALKDFEWWSRHVAKGNMIRIDDVDKLPAEAFPEKEILDAQQVKSLLGLPVYIDGHPYGLVGIDMVKKPANFTEEQVSSFHLFSTIFTEIIHKHITEESLHKESLLQDMLMKLATGFINLNLDRIDQAIQQSLEEMGEFVQADRAYIFDYDPANRHLNNTYEWCAEGISSHIDDLQNVPLRVIQDWYEKHIRGKPIIIDDVSTLPDELEQKQVLQAQNIQSLLVFPLLYNGNYLGFIGFDSVKNKHVYTEKEVKIMNVFAQMLVNVNQRKELHHYLIESREEAEQASRAKSTFLSNMSHEVRTPINGIVGFLDMMKHTGLTEEQKMYTENALKSAEDLMSIIDDILDFSTVETEKFSLLKKETNLRELMQQVISSVSYKAEHKGLAVYLDIHENVPEIVLTDPLRLKQILINLAGNAVKFTGEGRVDINVGFSGKKTSYDEDKGIFLFEIIDTGIGIDESNQKNLFKPFFQADTSMKRKYGGTGLGLILSKMIAEKMGTTIEFDSTPGKGSRFYFAMQAKYKIEIKKTDVEESPSETIMDTEESNKPDKLSILVAEDTELNRLLVRSFISKLFPDAVVIEAVNGREAVEKYKETKPDIIFMDMQMPVMSGFEAVKAIRQLETESGEDLHVPIVALTASVTPDAREQCIQAGMDFYISKPFRGHQIKETIDKFVFAK